MTDFMRLSSLQNIYQFLNRVDRPRKTGLMIMHCTLFFFFRQRYGRVRCVFGAGRDGKIGFPHETVRKKEVFESKNPVPFGGKRHHTSQSQTYMTSHMIWLLRDRGKMWE